MQVLLAHPSAGPATLESWALPPTELYRARGLRSRRATPASPRSVGGLACVRAARNSRRAAAALAFP